MDQCRRLLAAAEKASGTLTVGFVRRYDADWGTMGRLVTEGQIGRPVIWRCMAGHGRPGVAWFDQAELDARLGLTKRFAQGEITQEDEERVIAGRDDFDLLTLVNIGTHFYYVYERQPRETVSD